MWPLRCAYGAVVQSEGDNKCVEWAVISSIPALTAVERAVPHPQVLGELIRLDERVKLVNLFKDSILVVIIKVIICLLLTVSRLSKTLATTYYLWLLRSIYHLSELAESDGIQRRTNILTLRLEDLLLIFDILLLEVKGHIELPRPRLSTQSSRNSVDGSPPSWNCYKPI
jgi:hypothetical protein